MTHERSLDGSALPPGEPEPTESGRCLYGYLPLCVPALISAIGRGAYVKRSSRSQQGLVRGSWVVDGAIGFGRRTRERFD